MTAVEWLIEQIKNDQNQKALSSKEWMEVIEQAKEMEREQMASNCSQVISDEKIWEAAESQATFAPSFVRGIEWYREQLKNKQ